MSRTYTKEEIALANELLERLNKGESADFIKGFLTSMVLVDDGERVTEEAEREGMNLTYPAGWDEAYLMYKMGKITAQEFEQKFRMKRSKFIRLMEAYTREVEKE